MEPSLPGGGGEESTMLDASTTSPSPIKKRPISASQTSLAPSKTGSPQRRPVTAPDKKKKTGLKKTYYSKDHFSSRAADNESVAAGLNDSTRLVVRVLEGKNLMASDVMTGKSDPVCFVWCSSKEEKGLGAEDLDRDPRVQRTPVCPETCSPRWGSEMIFPLLLEDFKDLLGGRLVVMARDEDRWENDRVSYDELGYIEVPFMDIFKDGLITKTSISVVARRFPLLKSKGMSKVSGSIRLSIFLHVNEDDLRRTVPPGHHQDLSAFLHQVQGDIKQNLPPTRTLEIGPEPDPTITSPNLTASPYRRRSKDMSSSVVAPPLSLRSVLDEKEFFDDTGALDGSEMGTQEFATMKEGLTLSEGMGNLTDMDSTWDETTRRTIMNTTATTTATSLGDSMGLSLSGQTLAESKGGLLQTTVEHAKEGGIGDKIMIAARSNAVEEVPPFVPPEGPGDEALPPVIEETRSQITSTSPPSTIGDNNAAPSAVPQTSKEEIKPSASTATDPTPPPQEIKAAQGQETPVPPIPVDSSNTPPPTALIKAEPVASQPPTPTPTSIQGPGSASTPTLPSSLPLSGSQELSQPQLPAVVPTPLPTTTTTASSIISLPDSIPKVSPPVAQIQGPQAATVQPHPPTASHSAGGLAALANKLQQQQPPPPAPVEQAPHPPLSPPNTYPSQGPPTPSSHNTYTSKLNRISQFSRAALLATAVTSLKNSRGHARRKSSLSLSGVEPEWKNTVMQALGRLENRETFAMGLSELRELALTMMPSHVPAFISCIRKLTNARPLMTRIALLRLLSTVCREHGQAASRSIDGLISFLLDRIHDPESALREPCAHFTSSMAIHMLPYLTVGGITAAGATSNDVDLSRLLGPLLSVLSEQCVSAQESAGLCVAALAGPHPPPLTLHIQTTARQIDEARETFFQYSDMPNAVPPPKDMCLLRDGLLLLDFTSIAQARAFYVSRGAVGSLPADWKLQDFPEAEAKALQEEYNSSVKSLGHFCPRFLHGILGAMRQRSAVRRYLFRAVTNLTVLASTHPDGKRIGKSVCVAVPPVIERAISVLKESKREHFKDKIEAARLTASLSKCFECIPTLLDLRPALITALASCDHDSIRQVREACHEAMACLQELSSFDKTTSDLNTNTDSDDLAQTSEEPSLMAPGPGDESVPPFDAVTGVVESPDATPNKRSKTKKSKTADGDGVDSKLDSKGSKTIAAGNNTTTVRILKELGKTMTHTTDQLNTLVEKMCNENRTNMTTLIDRIGVLQQSITAKASSPPSLPPAPGIDTTVPVDGSNNPTAIPPPQPSPPVRPLPPPSSSSSQPMRAALGGVSLWREVQWLVHCGEVETAYERVLIDGNDRDLLRLMAKTRICLPLLAPHTKGLLFSTISRMIESQASYVDYVLPWVLQAAQTGDALELPRPVRKSLVKALYHLLALTQEPPTKPQVDQRGGGGFQGQPDYNHPSNSNLALPLLV